MQLCTAVKPRRGFTLIELAIVLGVIGIVTAGLWRLSAISNLQNKDQATAQQQLALISAVKTYLADTTPTTGGNAFLTAAGVGGIKNLPLPSSCTTATSWDITFCTYLPSGFTSNTTNPYGQKYTIQVVAGNPYVNQGYSFMIMTSGGSTIPDADGGRIASLIGGDGGFIYTNAVCTATVSATTACGALGAWSVGNVKTTYGFLSSASGTVASQTFVSSASSLNYNWLARVLMSGDTTTPPTYNTMTTDEYMGPNANTSSGTSFVGTNIDFPGSAQYAVPSGDALTPGAIHLGNSIIDGYDTLDTGNATPQIWLHSNSTAQNALIELSGNCTILTNSTCPPIFLMPTGDIEVQTGRVFGNQVTSSDRRFKTDIHPIVGALDNVMKMDPVSFTYKATGTPGMGLIAQDLEKIYPQLVVKDSKGMRFVSYDGLIGPLIESVQELKHENDDLRGQLAAQAERIEKLESKSTAP